LNLLVRFLTILMAIRDWREKRVRKIARDLSTRPKRYPAWQTAIQPPKDSPMDLVHAESSEERPFVELKKKREQGMRYSQVVGREGDGVGGDQAWADRTRSAHVSESPWHPSNSLPYSICIWGLRLPRDSGLEDNYI